MITFLTNELKQTSSIPWSATVLLNQFKTHPYGIAKRAVDVLHHRLYRGTYTKTITPIGVGDKAAQQAVGLWSGTSHSRLDAVRSKEGSTTKKGGTVAGEDNHDNDDDESECLVEPPPELINVECLWTERDQEAWYNRRFERITMEGFRDPRRGNSGTSR